MLLHNHATPRGKRWTIPQMNKGWATTVLCVCVCVCTGLFNESCYVRWGSEYLDMAYNAILSLYSIFMGPIQVCTVHVCACALLIVLPGTEPSTTWVFLVFSWADLLQTLALFVFCVVCLCRWKTIIDTGWARQFCVEGIHFYTCTDALKLNCSSASLGQFFLQKLRKKKSQIRVSLHTLKMPRMVKL